MAAFALATRQGHSIVSSTRVPTPTPASLDGQARPRSSRLSGTGTRGGDSRAGQVVGWTLGGVMVVLLLAQTALGMEPQDEGQLLTYPWLIAAGRLPYRDIWMSYPPSTYGLLAALQKTGIPGLVAERSVGLAAMIAYIALVNRLVSGSWRRFSWVALPATFAFVFLSGDVRAYPWTLGVPIFAAGLVATRSRPYLAALVFFVAGTFRFEFAVGGLAALVVTSLIERKDGGSLRYAGAAGALLCLSLGFYAALDVVTSGAAVRQILLQQIFDIGPIRRLPLFPPPISWIGAPVAVAALTLPLCLAILGILARKPWVVAVNVATGLMLSHFLQRADISHLFGAAALTVPWAIVSLVILMRSDGGAANRWRRYRSVLSVLYWVACGAGLWSILLTAAYAVYLSPLSPMQSQSVYDVGTRFVPAGSRSVVTYSSQEARSDRQVLAYLARHARSRDGLYIAPLSMGSVYTVTYLYYSAGLTPCGRNLELNAGVQTTPAVQTEMIRALGHCAWVVQVHGGDWYFRPAGTHPSAAPLDRFIADHYRRVLLTPDYYLLKRVRGG